MDSARKSLLARLGGRRSLPPYILSSSTVKRSLSENLLEPFQLTRRSSIKKPSTSFASSKKLSSSTPSTKLEKPPTFSNAPPSNSTTISKQLKTSRTNSSADLLNSKLISIPDVTLTDIINETTTSFPRMISPLKTTPKKKSSIFSPKNLIPAHSYVQSLTSKPPVQRQLFSEDTPLLRIKNMKKGSEYTFLKFETYEKRRYLLVNSEGRTFKINISESFPPPPETHSKLKATREEDSSSPADHSLCTHGAEHIVKIRMSEQCSMITSTTEDDSTIQRTEFRYVPLPLQDCTISSTSEYSLQIDVDSLFEDED